MRFWRTNLGSIWAARLVIAYCNRVGLKQRLLRSRGSEFPDSFWRLCGSFGKTPHHDPKFSADANGCERILALDLFVVGSIGLQHLGRGACWLSARRRGFVWLVGVSVKDAFDGY